MVDGDGYGGPSPWGDAGRIAAGSGGAADHELREVPSRSARHLAASLPAASRVPWRGLEVAAFARHPAVQDALDPRRTWRRAADRLPRTGLTALTLLTALGTAVTTTVLGSSATNDVPAPATADAVAAVAMTASTSTFLARWASWLVTRASGRRPVSADLWVAVAVVLLVHGIGTVAWMSSTDRWPTGVVVPLVVTVAAALLAVAVGVVASRPASYGARRAGVAGGPGELAATLPERERARIERDVAQALDVLERRGLADAAVLERARGAALGELTTSVERSSRQGRRGRASRPPA
ncbi:hypothetical protein [Nocardioides alkalitolerans]|uniref:hypothetical protein n=1 Tax=Nocardioides alkalitolerans TaxID=281714 RepID=UPI00048A4952|nr:hypothetical protein [Nocardioides alkalitolerans]